MNSFPKCILNRTRKIFVAKLICNCCDSSENFTSNSEVLWLLNYLLINNKLLNQRLCVPSQINYRGKWNKIEKICFGPETFRVIPATDPSQICHSYPR